MAEIILSSIINKSAEIVGNLLVQQGSRLYWLKEDINWLQREMRHIRSYIDDAKAKAVEGDSRVKNLMNDIQELASDVEDLLDEFLPKIQESHKSKGQLGCLKKACIPSPASFYDEYFAMEIEKIRRRVAEIDRVRTTYNIMDTSNNNNQHDYIIPLDRRRLFLHADDTEVIGLDDDFNKLQAKLLDQDMPYGVISIVGMPGLGKTTLAKKLYRHVHDQFECSALACVSQKPRGREILLDIAKQVGLAEEERKENLENKLRSFLKGKRYVILLDDIWDTDIWDYLKLVLPEVHSKAGSKIVITSRNSEVGKYIGGDCSIHSLKNLDSNNSFELFTKKTFTFDNNNNWANAPPTLENIARDIVKKCGGIPLAIVVIAGILKKRERTEHAWNRVLKSMSHKIEDGCAKILALSYNDLPPELRPCFLYFGLFPEDCEIGVFDLANMWIAERFIPEGTDNRRDAEDTAEDFLNDLVSRNLIQVARRTYEGRIASCRIHDLLHSLCVVLAKESNFFHTKDNTRGDPDSVARLRRITLDSDNIREFFSSNPKREKLRVLCCFTADPFIFSLMTPRNFKLLQVLVVVVPLGRWRGTIPNEIGNMSYLRYIRIQGCFGRPLPCSIVKLKRLETLDARGSCIYLPSGVWESQQLRHLRCLTIGASNGCFSIRQFFPINMSLPNLQTLLWVNVNFIHQGFMLHQSTNLRKLGLELFSSSTAQILSSPQPILSNLEVLMLKFDIHTLDKVTCQQINLSSYQNLLELHLYFPPPMPLNFEAFPPNLVKLTLFHLGVDDHLLAALKKLHKLRILQMDHCTHVEEKIDLSGDADSFQQLEVLHIENPRGFSSVIVDDVSVPKLNKVVLTNVPSEFRLSERLAKLRI